MTITAVRAARVDLTMERGGAWRRVVRRRTFDRVAPVAAPCTLTLYRSVPGSVAAGAQALAVDGVVAADGTEVEFTVTATTTDTLTAGRYQYRVTVTDPLLGALVLLRGYLTVRDGVEG